MIIDWLTMCLLDDMNSLIFWLLEVEEDEDG